jgi:RNA recognition motif-containing protein
LNIYVGNLSKRTTEEAVREVFAKYGEVKNVKLIKDKYTNELRGYGFVEMASRAEAVKAIENVNGYELGGRNLTVNEAKPRQERSFSFNWNRTL